MPSKKQSAAKPPDETVFFIDLSLGVEPIRTELLNAGLVVQIHDDHFARDAEDRVWLRTVGERGWVVLTKDQRLRYRPLEIAALRASNARVFVLTAGNLRGSLEETTPEVFPIRMLPRSRAPDFGVDPESADLDLTRL